ncbi:hypothetical protein B4U80_07266, partial [Leptotrombidium deliense]
SIFCKNSFLRSTATTSTFVLIIQICDALRILMLDIPSPTVLGESVELTCNYELDNDQLYSIKWYHNDVEFYRYVPNDWPPGQFLPMPGIKVDLSRSGKNVVYLRHVDLKTSGLFRCEVSAEAPEFKTAELEKEMKVFVLPVEGPRITGSRVRYNVGDTVNINCTSAKSKPAAKLKWFINDEVSATKYELEYLNTLHTDGLETSTLGLRFIVNEKHFQQGNMKLKCTATISRVYAMSNEALVLGERKASPLQINYDSDTIC